MSGSTRSSSTCNSTRVELPTNTTAMGEHLADGAYNSSTMSFDLAVWHTEQPLTYEQASDIYLRLCEEWPYLGGGNAAVQSFYEELIQHWPEIDSIPEEKVGDFDVSPWSCALDHSGMAVIMACVWPQASEVAEYVTALARKHGLLLFDPQARRVILPEHLTPTKRGFLSRLLGRFGS